MTVYMYKDPEAEKQENLAERSVSYLLERIEGEGFRRDIGVASGHDLTGSLDTYVVWLELKRRLAGRLDL